jgi:hypothetical protein
MRIPLNRAVYVENHNFCSTDCSTKWRDEKDSQLEVKPFQRRFFTVPFREGAD